MERLIGKEHQNKITKELVIEVMLRVALKELEGGGKDSAIKEVLKEIEGRKSDEDRGVEL